MNYDVSVFGKFPYGYVKKFKTKADEEHMKEMYSNCKAATQMVVHRHEGLMYYNYLSKIDGDFFVGISLSFNACYLTDVDKLFHVFEEAIGLMLQNGWFVAYNGDGRIICNATDRKKDWPLLDKIEENVRAGFDSLSVGCSPLPARDTGLSAHSSIEFQYNDDRRRILEASYNYGHTYIYKGDYTLPGLEKLLKSLDEKRKQIASLEADKKSLKAERDKLKRQNEHFTKVVVASVVAALLGLCSYVIYRNLSTTKAQLADANRDIEAKAQTIEQRDSTIVQRDSIIGGQHAEIANLVRKASKLTMQRDSSRKALAAYDAVVSNNLPFFFKNLKFNYDSGKLSFNYVGFKPRVADIVVRAISSGSQHPVTVSRKMQVKSGAGRESVFVCDTLNGETQHYFEILYKGVVIGGGQY